MTALEPCCGRCGCGQVVCLDTRPENECRHGMAICADCWPGDCVECGTELAEGLVA